VFKTFKFKFIYRSTPFIISFPLNSYKLRFGLSKTIAPFNVLSSRGFLKGFIPLGNLLTFFKKWLILKIIHSLFSYF
jgi:hypothetical protein